MVLKVDETLFPFDVGLYFDPQITDWQQNPEHLVLQYIYVMRKCSKECYAVSKQYHTHRDFYNFFQQDKPKKTLITIFKLLCTAKKRSRLDYVSYHDYAGSFDYEMKDFHHLELNKTTCDVFFINKKGLLLYKFTLKWRKKRWYINDFYYFQNMQEWQLSKL